MKHTRVVTLNIDEVNFSRVNESIIGMWGAVLTRSVKDLEDGLLAKAVLEDPDFASKKNAGKIMGRASCGYSIY